MRWTKMADDNERNMAEAVVDQPRNRFYCHQCSVEINPTLPQYTCPRCDNGFIEEITESFRDEAPAAADRGSGIRHIDLTDLWSQQLLDTFRQASEPQRQPGGGASANPSSGQPPTAPSQQPPQQPERGSDTDDDDDLWSVQPPPDMEDVMDYTDDELIPNVLFPRAHIHLRPLRRGGGRAGPGRGGVVYPPGGAMPLQNLIGQLLSGLSGAGGGAGGMPPFIFGNLMGPGGPGGLHGNPGDYAWGPGGLDAIISQLMNQLEGSGPPAASKEQIDKLPTTQITKEQADDGAQCSVCMEDFALEETVRQLPCQHCYHTDCIIPWLKIHGTCPVCRKTLDGQDTSCQEESLMDAVQGATPSQPGDPSSPSSSSSAPPQPSSATAAAPSTSSSRDPPPPPRDFESEYD